MHAIPRTDQTIERLTDHLVNEEALLNLRSRSENHFEALATNAKKNFNKKATTVFDKNGQNKHKSTRRPGKCNFCHIPGHWARECEKKKKALQGARSNESLLVKSKSSDGVHAADKAKLLMVDSHKYSEAEDTWYADSGVTEHMSFCRHWFKNFTQYPEDVHSESWRWYTN